MLPALAKQYDLRDAVFLAELNLDQLLARRNPAKSFKPLPQFPAIRRDVAMLVPEATTHDAVLQIVKQAKPANLEAVELFDVFRGKNVPEGQKSMAYAFTYRSARKDPHRHRGQLRPHESPGRAQKPIAGVGAGILMSPPPRV